MRLNITLIKGQNAQVPLKNFTEINTYRIFVNTTLEKNIIVFTYNIDEL